MEIWVLTFVLILVRTASFLAAVPFLGAQTMPRTVLVGLSLALSLMWYGRLDQPPEHLVQFGAAYTDWLGFFLAGLRETLVGLLLGTTFGIVSVSVADGRLIPVSGIEHDQFKFDGCVFASQLECHERRIRTLGLLLVFGLNMHLFVLEVLGESFRRLPLGRPLMLDASSVMVDCLCAIEQQGLAIVAPTAVCMFVVLIGLLLLNKASPQMNVFAIGMSVRVFAGCCSLWYFCPAVFRPASC